MKHINLANQVIEMLLKGEDEVLVRLRSQMENVKSISEESSTVGFYINYEVDKYVIDNRIFKLAMSMAAWMELKMQWVLFCI